MDPEVKTKWVAALRGGKYRQGRKRLRTPDDRFCCLGVLCDIEGAEWSERDDEHGWEAIIDGSGNWGDLPTPFRQRLRIPFDEANRISSMNDEGKSFTDIAEYIERYL